MEKISFKNKNGANIIMSAIVNFPPEFAGNKQYPAIVVTHPGGGVKEQTAGLYAEKLAEQGFITIAADASYQGESTGKPRQLENPYIRVEDISAVIDYLTTLSYVDRERIGALGVCAGGGYTASAAVGDRRIKALATVSMANFGAMLRHGWEGTESPEQVLAMLEFGSQARTDDANSGETVIFPIVPVRKEDASHEDLAQAWEYYRTPRCQKDTAPGHGAARSLTQLAVWDALNMVDLFLTQPLLIIAGRNAGSKWMSDQLYERAASKNKTYYVVEGASHMSLYDIPQYVGEALSKLSPFFKTNL
ncbi:alpha/beta hydrolase [Propionispora hippei]|uniref:Dienelactone hydrolase domain-containing protein n=1 Tax=Propionispora hippei DSM 15287 TaxID=1123003 RepID=A0A1M6KFP1_9FIRM|nr:alpha/beta hydrolase [Propionispora hippei]SHJ57748.1 hypothetical protein SAMN02745170_02844 [Propionispora hippei DSM 15287]